MAGKSSEDYWNTSSSASFNFDDDTEVEKAFSNSCEIFDSTASDSVFGSNIEENNAQTMLPMHSLVTKRNLDTVLDDVRIPTHSSVPLVQETITKMFLGMPYTLYVYRSLDQKLELLDEAVATEDGNIILTVLLYLKKTLKLTVLYHNLLKRKIALEHYTNYLMRELKLEELADFYMVTGNYSDIVYLFYLGCRGTVSTESMHVKLLRFLAEHQSKLDHDKNVMFTDYKNFLKWQMDSKMTTNSVVEQLALLYKSEAEKKSDNKSIMAFKQTFKISDFQYEWIQLNVLGVLKQWKKITELFIKPNWLTKKNSIKTVIDVELFISTLYKHNPPKEIVEEFLSCVVDSDISIGLAKKMKCHKFVIDAYIAQRDRLSILNYKNNIPNQSEEYFYAENALRSTDKKWKN
ncbi:hypothetical protein ILUMI_22282 [Ignelater luminosus]|uniref:Vps16 C-terminal domain-containing protein n=1 Tax=Ignelater luminosus TaxID=2038154 RepID=A0A8K0CH21_IGNLU|nr:hypothetical protein ILUMI_22282 [Ignelater luminosus]